MTSHSFSEVKQKIKSHITKSAMYNDSYDSEMIPNSLEFRMHTSYFPSRSLSKSNIWICFNFKGRYCIPSSCCNELIHLH